MHMRQPRSAWDRWVPTPESSPCWACEASTPPEPQWLLGVLVAELYVTRVLVAGAYVTRVLVRRTHVACAAVRGVARTAVLRSRSGHWFSAIRATQTELLLERGHLAPKPFQLRL